MKILGENSLSSRVIVGLNILFTIIFLTDMVVLSTIAKAIYSIIIKEDIESNILNLTLFIMIIATGIIALFIIYQFIKIFKNLKKNILFCENNSKSLDIISKNCFIISAIYFIISIFLLLIISNLIGEFIYFIFTFSIMFMVIFTVLGIGLKILNEIYKKAIEYKEENDFTI